MITPTIGRVVWFHAGAHATNLVSDQPLAAMITYVNSDDTINLVVFGKGGDCHQRASVPLWQGVGDAPEHRTYAEWMPYQKGQAAKLEEAEANGAAGDVVEPASTVGGMAEWQAAENKHLSEWKPAPSKPTYSATPVKPSTEPVQPLPPAPVDPDPYASSVW